MSTPAQSRLQQLVDAAFASEMRWDRAQEKVTDGALLPSMPRIVDALGRARRAVDAEMRARAATETWVGPSEVAGAVTIADYPVGFCQVIRDAVRARLRDDPEWRTIVRRGVVVRDVFVILKGRYFQNAMQVGNLYVDVANDTVDPAKHWLEWAPVREVDYENASDISRIAAVSAAYHGCSVHPNTVFPLLAPVVPLLAVRSNGRIDLLDASPMTFLKDLPSGLAGHRHWVESGFGGVPSLPVAHVATLRAACGRNDASAFPFEFRPCAAPELLEQASAFADAARDPSRHDLITTVLDLVPKAARQLRDLQGQGGKSPPS
ncbi:MAG: hypothetical protein ACKOHI_07020 [Phycisphaerales bacterium]